MVNNIESYFPNKNSVSSISISQNGNPFYDNDNDGYIDLISDDGNAYRVGFEFTSAFDPSSLDLSLNSVWPNFIYSQTYASSATISNLSVFDSTNTEYPIDSNGGGGFSGSAYRLEFDYEPSDLCGLLCKLWHKANQPNVFLSEELTFLV